MVAATVGGVFEAGGGLPRRVAEERAVAGKVDVGTAIHGRVVQVAGGFGGVVLTTGMDVTWMEVRAVEAAGKGETAADGLASGSGEGIRRGVGG